MKRQSSARRTGRSSAAPQPPARPSLAAGSRRPAWPVLLALAGVCAALVTRYAWTLGLSWFNDDFLLLDHARTFGLASLLPSGDAIGNAWRPVSRAAWFALVRGIAGDAPVAFHVAHLALACAALLLFFAVARRVLAGRDGAPADGAALCAVALLSVHPAIATLLAWAAGAQDLLALVFGFAAMACACHRRWAAATACFALALLSKETAALLPLVLAAIAVVVEGASVARALRRTATCWALLAGWLVANPYMPWRAAHAAAMPHVPPGGAIGPTLAALLLTEPRTGFAWLAPAAATGVAVTLLGAALAVAMRAPWPRGAARGAWLVAGAWTLAVVAPLAATASVPLYYAFAPAAGLALAVTAALAALRAAPARAAVAALACAACVASSGVTHAEVRLDGHTMRAASERLWSYRRDLRAAHPAFPRGAVCYFLNVPHNSGFQTADGPALRVWYGDPSLRGHYLSAYRPSAAPAYFFACDSVRSTLTEVRVAPPDAAARRAGDLYAYALTDIGARFQELGEDSLADVAWRSGLALRPGDPLLRVNLGQAAVARGRFAEGRALLLPAVAAMPGDADARLALGFAEARLGATDEARVQFRAVIARAPGTEAAARAAQYLAALDR